MRHFPAAGQTVVNVALGELVTFVQVDTLPHVLVENREGDLTSVYCEDLESLETFVRLAHQGEYTPEVTEAAKMFSREGNPFKVARGMLREAARLAVVAAL